MEKINNIVVVVIPIKNELSYTTNNEMVFDNKCCYSIYTLYNIVFYIYVSVQRFLYILHLIVINSNQFVLIVINHTEYILKVLNVINYN